MGLFCGAGYRGINPLATKTCSDWLYAKIIRIGSDWLYAKIIRIGSDWLYARTASNYIEVSIRGTCVVRLIVIVRRDLWCIGTVSEKSTCNALDLTPLVFFEFSLAFD